MTYFWCKYGPGFAGVGVRCPGTISRITDLTALKRSWSVAVPVIDMFC